MEPPEDDTDRASHRLLALAREADQEQRAAPDASEERAFYSAEPRRLWNERNDLLKLKGAHVGTPVN